MKQNNRKQQAEAAGMLIGVGFAGSMFAMGVAWLFYAMTVEYVRLVSQVLTYPKI